LKSALQETLFSQERGLVANVTVDDELLDEAQKFGRHQPKQAAVTEALEEYIRRQKQLDILELFGRIEYDYDYDYKVSRR
jgi:hypothetical protein